MLANARKVLPTGTANKGTVATFSLGATALHAASTISPGSICWTRLSVLTSRTGALSVWRGAFRLLEKAAGAALDNKVGGISRRVSSTATVLLMR